MVLLWCNVSIRTMQDARAKCAGLLRTLRAFRAQPSASRDRKSVPAATVVDSGPAPASDEVNWDISIESAGISVENPVAHTAEVTSFIRQPSEDDSSFAPIAS